jgi:hypothetical protein
MQVEVYMNNKKSTCSTAGIPKDVKHASRDFDLFELRVNTECPHYSGYTSRICSLLHN